MQACHGCGETSRAGEARSRETREKTVTQTPKDVDPEEKAAIAFCREHLREHPQAIFRDVRALAFRQGVRVDRRIFSAVQREMGGGPPAEEVLSQPLVEAPGQAAVEAAAAAVQEVAEDVTGKEPQAPAAPPRWDQLFGSEAEPTPEPSAVEPPAPAAEPITESATESARRALGLLSPPAATDTPRLNAVEFMAAYLRDHPEAPYKEVRELAEAEGYTVSSATFGRAQAVAGLLDEDEEQAPAPERAPEPKKVRRPSTRGRRRGRDPALLLEEFIASWEDTELERRKLRKALKAMLDVVEQALKAG